MTNVECAVDRLIGMGYLKYTPESEVAAARAELVESLSRKYLDTRWADACISRDRRSYPADSEELAEGGIAEIILLMKDVLEVEGARLDVVEDDFGDEQYDVTINGRRYKILNSAMTTGNAWAIASKRFLEITNELLKAAGSKECLYGIYGGNDGRFILLTDEMYSFLGSSDVKINPGWMPYPSSAISHDGRIDRTGVAP